MSRTLGIKLAVDHTLGATFKSNWIDARGSRFISIQLSSDNVSSPVGTWSIEESNDPVAEREIMRGAGGDSTASTAAVASIGSDALRVSVNGTGLAVAAANSTTISVYDPASFVRLVYTRTSGGGTAKAQIWVHGRD